MTRSNRTVAVTYSVVLYAVVARLIRNNFGFALYALKIVVLDYRERITCVRITGTNANTFVFVIAAARVSFAIHRWTVAEVVVIDLRVIYFSIERVNTIFNVTIYNK